MNSISQDMKFRYSLMKYVEKFGVSKACRKYNKCRSYIYFWKARFDGSIESLACHSRKPHSHPNQHTEEELILIRNMRRRNPKLGIVELWARLRNRGYTRCLESLWRVLRREGAGRERKAPEEVQTQALRTDAVSRPALPDRCESCTAKLYSRPVIETVSVHSDR